ncbi:MAG: TetR/AcrR family transcriptional regulator [Caulobacterales bacterium]
MSKLERNAQQSDAPPQKKRVKSPKPPAGEARAPVRRRMTQAERRDQTRAKILDASAVLLRKRGYSGLRTLEVAEAAGVSQGAQFHHFPTKRDLVIATIDHINAGLLDASRRRAQSGRAHADAISEIIADAGEFFFSDYFFIELAIGITSDDDPALQDAVRARTREFRSSVEEAWAQSLRKSGMRSALADDVLSLTLSLVRGFAVRTLIDPDQSQAKRLFKIWRAILERHIEESQ